MKTRKYGTKTAIKTAIDIQDELQNLLYQIYELAMSKTVKDTDWERDLGAASYDLQEALDKMRFDVARCSPDQDGFNYRQDEENAYIDIEQE